MLPPAARQTVRSLDVMEIAQLERRLSALAHVTQQRQHGRPVRQPTAVLHALQQLGSSDLPALHRPGDPIDDPSLGCCGTQIDDGGGWSEDAIRSYRAPTLITVGDCDMVKLEHAVRFLQLRGGDVNGDFVGVPASQLAVFPGSTHFFGMARTNLVLDVVTTFLDSEPAGPTVG